MNNLSIIFPILLGGALTLLGTLLANFLQFRAEKRRIKTELVKERLVEVRRYILTCLEFVDLVSIPSTLGQEQFGEVSYSEWLNVVAEHLEKWKNLPVSGSARVLYSSDKELLDGLKQIDKLRIVFYLNYLDITHKGKVIPHDAEREELKEIAMKVGKRLDKILEEI